MSSKELQADIVKGLKELHEGKVMRPRSAKGDELDYSFRYNSKK
jgi:hypothetical protein